MSVARPVVVRRTGAIVLLLAVAGIFVPGPGASALARADDTRIFPLAEVRRGIRGTGLTVMEGTEPESFEFEVLGVLEDVYPKQDLIIARLSGLGLEKSGVIAGMSGSPVYVDGRLMGAVGYRLADFGQEAIAGIMPIESMLAVQRRESERGRGAGTERDGSPGAAATSETVRNLLAAVARAATGTSGGDAVDVPDVLRPMVAAGGLQPIGVPLSVGGLDPRLVDRLSPVFEAVGWRPVAGGSSGSGLPMEPELGPGGAVGVQLMRGDINFTSTGTITYRDGDQLLAFGHPFLQGGAVDFPMVGAEVITILGSFAASNRLTRPGSEIVGAVRQDRLAAILGVIGVQPRLIPVKLDIDYGSADPEEVRFELVSDKVLTPLFLFTGLVNAVQGAGQAFGESTIEIDAEFDLGAEREKVRVHNAFASDSQAIVSMAATIAAVFGYVHDNEFGRADVRGVELMVRVRQDRQTARITRVWTDRNEVQPGEIVQLSVTMQPYRGAALMKKFFIEIPEGTPDGPITVLVGGATAIGSEEQGFVRGAVAPRTLGQLLRLVNGMRRNDRVYVMVSQADAGAVVDGVLMPSLPPSVMQVLGSRQASGDVIPLDRAVLVETFQEVDFVVSGSHRFELRVRRQ